MKERQFSGKKDWIANGRSRQRSSDYFSVYFKIVLTIFHYKEQQEVDFLIANEDEPLVLIEAKLSDREPSPALKKFQNVLKKPAIQLVGESETYRMIPNGDQYILVAPAYLWLSGLP